MNFFNSYISSFNSKPLEFLDMHLKLQLRCRQQGICLSWWMLYGNCCLYSNCWKRSVRGWRCSTRTRRRWRSTMRNVAAKCARSCRAGCRRTNWVITRCSLAWRRTWSSSCRTSTRNSKWSSNKSLYSRLASRRPCSRAWRYRLASGWVYPAGRAHCAPPADIRPLVRIVDGGGMASDVATMRCLLNAHPFLHVYIHAYCLLFSHTPHIFLRFLFWSVVIELI